jgi:large subunit ribosomal protein L6
MSRIGKVPVAIPDGVDVKLDGGNLTVKGKKGELAMSFVDDVIVEHNDNVITIKPRDDSKRSRSMWGMQRSLAQNLVTGVTEGFVKQLELVGVGYRAAVKGKILNLQLGYSHDIDFPIPEGITIECERPTAIKISGIDAQKVGQTAAVIRAYRKPEPYKGKGVKYVDEYIFRKEGKKK